MFRSSVYITLLTLIGSVLGFVVQLLIARRFGVGIEVDTYLIAISVPTFISGMISAMLSYNIVPRIIASENNPEDHHRYIGSIFLAVSFISLIATPLLGYILLSAQMYSLPTASQIKKNSDLEVLMFLAWATGAFQIILGCLSALLNAIRKHFSGAAIGLLPYVGMVLLLLLLNRSLGIIVVLIGMLTGTVLAVIVAILILRLHLFPLPWRKLLWTKIRQLAYCAPYTAIAMTCFSSYAIIDAYWAPRAGEGVLASLGYAQRIVIGIGSLVVAGPSAILVPKMAGFVQQGNYKSFYHFLVRSLWVVGGIGICIALSFLILAESLIAVLFARGAFGNDEILIVSGALIHMAPGMAAMLISVIQMRAIFCFENSAKVAAAVGATWSILYFFFSSFLYSHGAIGLASAYSISWVLFSIILFAVILKLVNNV